MSPADNNQTQAPQPPEGRTPAENQEASGDAQAAEASQPSQPVVEVRPSGNPDAPEASRYNTPQAGNQPPQTVREQRDLAQRERTMLAYRQLEQRELGGDVADATEALDVEFYENGYDARSRIKHEPDAVVDEHERLQEINALYLDQCLENYIARVNETECQRAEAKYGRGLLGGVRRWLHETDIGKGVNILAKGGVAAGVVALTSHNLLAPAGLLMAKKLGTDAVLEGVQYGFERPVLCNLQGLKTERHDIIQELMQLRNQIANRDNDHDLGENARQVSINGNNIALHDQMERIITELNQIEMEMLEEERVLALIRTIGKSVRAVATLAWSATAIYELFAHGLLLNLDGIADPTQALGHLTPEAAAHHIVTSGTNPGIYHDVKVAADGMRFVYETGETMGNGLLAYGGETHLLGGAAAAKAGLTAGLIGASLADVPIHIYDAIRSNRMRRTMHNTLESPLEDENKQHQAVYTVTGRDSLGPTSGVDHEISAFSGLSRDRDRRREQIEIKKEKFQSGFIFKVPKTLIGGPSNPLPPFASASGLEYLYIQVSGWEDDGDSKKKNLKYVLFNPDSDKKLTTNYAGIINDSTVTLCEEARADNIIDQAEKVAESYDQFYKDRSSSGKQATEKLAERLAQPEISSKSTWRAEKDFKLSHDGGDRQINAGDIITVENLNTDKSYALISVKDSTGNKKGDYKGVGTEQILRECIAINLQQEKQEKQTALLNSINSILKTQGMPSSQSLKEKMVFSYNDGTNARWLAVTGLNVEEGELSFKICDYDQNGEIPSGKDLKRIINSVTAEQMTFQEFFDRFSARNPQGSFSEQLTYSSTRIT